MLDLRIMQKKDTEANWISANPVLLNGEIILVETPDRVRLKVGDGSSRYLDLPFTDLDIYNKVNDKANTDHKHEFARGRVTVGEDGITSITVPSAVLSNNQIDYSVLVYQNGLLLEQDIHYTIGTGIISLVDTSAKVGDIFSFVKIN